MRRLQQRLARFGVEFLECEVLKLFPDFLNAHAPGKRRINLHRFLRDALALVGGIDEMQRPHVVQPVCKLDQQHTNIVRHREQELAEILGLLRTFGRELKARQLGHAVDEASDLRTEQLRQLVHRRAGIFHRVVQERRHDGRGIELQFRQDAGDFDRMGKIRIAAGTHLAAMLFHGIDIGAVDQGFVRLRIVAEHAIDELILTQHSTILLRRVLPTS